MDVELREVRDFLAEHAPFNSLPEKVLDGLPRRLHLRYFRRGSTIIDLGAANNSLYILRSGAADIHGAAGELVERSDPGTSFGTSSVLNREPSAYRIVAIEDCLVLVMPGEVFHQLLATQPAFAEFFGAASPQRIRRAVAELQGHDSGRIILHTKISDMLGREPVTTEPDTTIRQAAELMTDQRVSALPITSDGTLVGIITDRDLRRKVVTRGLDVDLPVAGIMTTSPFVIRPGLRAFEAMLEMLSRNVHHLPVVEDGRLLGIVSSGDLMRLETANPVFLVGDIAKQESADDLAQISARVPRLVTQLVEQDASAEEIHRVVTAVSDAVTRRLLELTEADLGPPPVPYTWLVLGSQARQEHGLNSDQDHVLLLSDEVRPEHDTYFAELAERLVSGLERNGFVRCPGNVMSTNPQWRLSLAGWKQNFHGWIAEPTSQAILHAQIFFDARAVHGDRGLADELRRAVLGATPTAQRFLGHLATMATERQVPIGFFRGFVLEREGEHRDTLDLKSGGVHAVIEIARVYALAHGITPVNTVERLQTVAALGSVGRESLNDLLNAYEFICYVRLRHQARQVAQGEKPDNHVSPDSLTSFERRHLRDAFGIVRRMQQALGVTYHTHLMS